jgi:hypothetical protein
MRVRGRCPACDTDRLLPGRNACGAAICRDCAGISRDFFCDRCGFEGMLLGGRLCERCTLADKLTTLLDEGTGEADLDAWHAEKYATRRPARVFLRWCMTTRRMPTLTIPDRITMNSNPMGQHHWIPMLQRILTAEVSWTAASATACSPKSCWGEPPESMNHSSCGSS